MAYIPVEHMKVSVDLSNSIIDGLLTRARLRDWDTFSILDKLSGYPRIAEGLFALACDEQVSGWVRARAAVTLGILGQTDHLLAIAHDEKILGWVRIRAAAMLGELRQMDSAISILLALASNEKVSVWIRREATETLGRLADVRVLPELEHITQHDKDEQARRAARDAIGRIRERMEHNHDDTRTTLPYQD